MDKDKIKAKKDRQITASKAVVARYATGGIIPVDPSMAGGILRAALKIARRGKMRTGKRPRR